MGQIIYIRKVHAPLCEEPAGTPPSKTLDQTSWTPGGPHFKQVDS